jgi:hypothetical protein
MSLLGACSGYGTPGFQGLSPSRPNLVSRYSSEARLRPSCRAAAAALLSAVLKACAYSRRSTSGNCTPESRMVSRGSEPLAWAGAPGGVKHLSQAGPGLNRHGTHRGPVRECRCLHRAARGRGNPPAGGRPDDEPGGAWPAHRCCIGAARALHRGGECIRGRKACWRAIPPPRQSSACWPVRPARHRAAVSR